jgi:transposase
MEQWAQIRHLHAQGLSVRTIARTLEISRNTVARYLGADTAPTYRPRAKDPSLLVPYEDYLRRRLAEFPELRSTRLFREVRAQGYTGSYATLRRFLQPLRPGARSRPSTGLRRHPGSKPKSTGPSSVRSRSMGSAASSSAS